LTVSLSALALTTVSLSARTAEVTAPIEAPAPTAVTALTFHRSSYFLTGFTRNTQAKYQISVKFDLWPTPGRHTVYLAYSQKSLWDIYNYSVPFRETNYNPEVFYAHYHSVPREEPSPGCGWFSERAGFEHESNGGSVASSRSWNRLFIDLRLACRRDHAYVVSLARVWLPFTLDDNPDILQTLGYGELGFTAGMEDPNRPWLNGVGSLALRKGTSATLAKGSVQVDVRYRLFGIGWPYTPFFWSQLFVGYGETLLTYNEPTTSFRIGFGLSDHAAR
jgi:phospholipase A1